MARIDIPAGSGTELERLWQLSPQMGEAVSELSRRVNGRGQVPWRVREAARMKIAHLNGCSVCMSWRTPQLERHGVTEDLYAHVDDPGNHEYSAAESLALDFAERFCLDHRSIDAAYFERLKECFSDVQILELTACIADWVGMGRMTAILDLDQACTWQP
jgi:AhpD family alkylhydroperoxidase